MKKITLLFIACIAMVTWSYSQCTTSAGGQWPSTTVTLANNGGVETIVSNNWPNAEYSIIENVLPGSDYTVAATPSLYITVTNTADDSVIVHGAGSVSFTAAAGVTGLTIYWHLDATCAVQASGDTVTTIQCTTCTCTFTEAPSCVTEILPADGETSAIMGSGPSMTFTWNSDPLAESYELFINGFSQGPRSSGITFTGLTYATAYTWQVVPSNCFGTATGCPTWSFTTESCTVLAAPNAVSTPTPADIAIDIPIDATDPANLLVTPFAWVAATSGDPATSFNISLGTDTAGTDIGTLDNFTNGEGVIYTWANNTTYYWSVEAVNCIGTTAGPVWSFTTGTALSVDDNQINLFSVYPNPVKDVLKIKTDLSIDSVKILNQLGQNVLAIDGNKIFNNEIDLSSLSSGLYFMNISSDEKSQTIKVIKE